MSIACFNEGEDVDCTLKQHYFAPWWPHALCNGVGCIVVFRRPILVMDFSSCGADFVSVLGLFDWQHRFG